MLLRLRLKNYKEPIEMILILWKKSSIKILLNFRRVLEKLKGKFYLFYFSNFFKNRKTLWKI